MLDTADGAPDRAPRLPPEYAWVMPDVHPEQFYSVAELAAGLGYSEATIRNWVEAGRFPGAIAPKGSAIRVPRSSVLAFLREQPGMEGA